MIFFILDITFFRLKLVKAVINPGNGIPEIMGYVSPHINKVNHNSAFASISLYLGVETNRLKFFVYITLIILIKIPIFLHQGSPLSVKI